jgi:hypothetical protein
MTWPIPGTSCGQHSTAAKEEMVMGLFKRTKAVRDDHKPTWRERRAADRTAKAEAKLRQTEQEIHDLAARARTKS